MPDNTMRDDMMRDDTTPGSPLAAQVMVIAKEPVPGRVKTRLTPPYTPAEAASLAEAALADTLAAVASAGVGRRIVALAAARLRRHRPARRRPRRADRLGAG